MAVDLAWEYAARQFEAASAQWETPGDLAVALDSRTVQTPALDLIDEELVRLANTPDGRLIISLAPQEGKSSRVAEIFPVWALKRNPDLRIVVASYGMALARRNGRAIRNRIVTNEPTLGLRLSDDLAAQHEWQLAGHSGGVYAAGIGSALTGRPCDLMIIDDPIKDRKEADSETYRQAVWDWWTDVASTRLAPGAPVVLILTRWHCLLPGSDILTDVGIVAVEDIRAGTRVITSAGAQEVVAAAAKPHSGDVISISSYGYPRALQVTPEHRVLTAEGWREAGRLRAMDWLVFPIPRRTTAAGDLRRMIPPPPKSKANAANRLTGDNLPVDRETLKAHLEAGLTYQKISELYGRKSRAAAYSWALHYGLTRPAGNVMTGDPTADPDFWRVVGYWLAEGDLTSGRKGGKANVVRWTFGHSEEHLARDITEVLARYGLTVHSAQSGRLRSISVRCSSEQLAAFLSECGHGAHNKILPETFVTLPDCLARELVRGYWVGDGTVTPDDGSMNSGWCRITSVSLGLLMGIYRLLPRLGIAPSIHKGGSKKHPKYEIRFPASSAPWLCDSTREVTQHSVRIDGDRLLVKIKKIEVSPYEGPVYDLQTPAHDFVANNFIVHNCDDLAGRLLAAEDGHLWRVVNIPAQADHDPNKGETDPLGREPGEFLQSARGRTREQWEAIKTRVGSRTWNALYQGRPSPAEGGVFKREWWREYTSPRWIVRNDGTHWAHGPDEVAMSWDMAFKDTDSSDYVVGQVWGRWGIDLYLLDQVCARLSFVETTKALRALAAKWPQAVLKLVEDKANGTAVINALSRTVPGIVPVEPDGSKQARAAAVSPFIEAGQVHLPAPELAPWVGAFIEQCVIGSTVIITRRGLIPASEIQVGDEVLTHRGRFRPVTATSVREAPELVTIQAKTLDPITLTPNHPVYAMSVRRNAGGYHVPIEKDWVPAGEVACRTAVLSARGQVEPSHLPHHAMTIPVVAPEHELREIDLRAWFDTEVPQPKTEGYGRRTYAIVDDGETIRINTARAQPLRYKQELDYPFGRICGLYLAEGSYSTGRAVWSLHKDETDLVEEITSFLRERWGINAHVAHLGKANPNCINVTTSLRRLEKFFDEFGRGAANKRIPWWAWEAPKPFVDGLISGWLDGDGHKTPKGWRGTTVSPHLAWGIRLLATRLRKWPLLRWTEPRKPSLIGQQVVTPRHAQFTVEFADQEKATHVFDGDHIGLWVRETESAGSGTVYNFTVAEDESYVTTAGAVHNCAAFPNGTHDDQVDATTQALNRLLLDPLLAGDELVEDEDLDEEISGYEISPY